MKARAFLVLLSLLAGALWGALAAVLGCGWWAVAIGVCGAACTLLVLAAPWVGGSREC